MNEMKYYQHPKLNTQVIGAIIQTDKKKEIT